MTLFFVAEIESFALSNLGVVFTNTGIGVGVVEGIQLSSSGLSPQYPPPIKIWSGMVEKLIGPLIVTPNLSLIAIPAVLLAETLIELSPTATYGCPSHTSPA